MNHWSNRSARLCAALLASAAAALLVGCGGTPRRASPAPDRDAGASGAAAAGAEGASTPVPERAANAYAEALRLLKAGDSTEAELQFKQLAIAYPEYSGPQLNLGLLDLRAGRLTEAETAFRAVLAHAPDNAVADNELGIALRRLGRFADAEAAYRNAIAAQPDYAAAHLNLGVLYDLYLGEPQKALTEFERYAELAGESKQVAGWLAELRKRVGAAPGAKKETG